MPAMDASISPPVDQRYAGALRLNRLDVMMGHLEEVKWGMTKDSSSTSPASVSSADWSPRSFESYRSCEDALEETKLKGTLINRLKRLEDQVFEMSLHLAERNARDKKLSTLRSTMPLKRLVESCVEGLQILFWGTWFSKSIVNAKS